nr:hypothetical protein [uncultured Roseateles sp.]
MAQNKHASRRLGVISASELAEMAVCERRVLLGHLHGERRTRAQRDAMQRGLRAHDRFHRDAQAVSRGASRRLASIVVGSLVRGLVRLWVWLTERAAKLFDRHHRHPKQPGSSE